MAQKADPKISTSEAVLILLFVLILDLIDLIPFAGDLTDIAGAPLFFYYMSKHINGVAYLIAEILDAIPGTQEIPSRTIVWIGTILFDRFAPAKLEEVVEQAGELGEGGEGAPGGELGEGGAVAEGAGTAEGVQSGAGAGEIEGGSVGEQGGEVSGGGQTEQGGGTQGEQTGEREGGGNRGEGGGGEQDESNAGNGYSSEEGGQEGDEGGEAEKKKDAEDPMATESEGNPMEENAEDLLENTPDANTSGSQDDDDEEEDGKEETPSNTVSIDSSKQWQNNQAKNIGAKPAPTPRSEKNMADVVPVKAPKKKAA